MSEPVPLRRLGVGRKFHYGDPSEGIYTVTRYEVAAYANGKSGVHYTGPESKKWPFSKEFCDHADAMVYPVEDKAK